jgi:MSHA biogenesis protein MshO
MRRAPITGFTLVELILVIVILGIMATATSSYLGLGAKMYAESAERDQLLSQSRFAIERLTRELRHVVPNSVRTWSNGGNHCIEFAPLVKTGRYSGNLVSPMELFSPADDWDALVSLNQSGLLYMTVYPVQADVDIYAQGRVASDLSLAVDTVDDRKLQLTFDFDSNIPQSPGQRIYFMTAPVLYCMVGSALYRYQRSSIEAVAGANLPAGVLMAEGLDRGFYSSTATSPFSYEQSLILTRHAVVHLRLAFLSAFGEPLVFNQEIHIPNVP